MTENTNINNTFWKKYIKSQIEENLNLFAEFELNRNHNTYHEFPIIFTCGYKLTYINKNELLRNIKEVIETNFNNCKYFITTRTKSGSLHYYIVVSLIKENNKTDDKIKNL